MIEWYRLDYTKRVSDTLTWNLYYNTHLDPDVLTLRTEEENIFANIMRVQTGLREVFMIIISRCCLIDLHKLWISSSMTQLWVRWNEYFQVKSEPFSVLRFHFEMSDEDIRIMHDVAQKWAIGLGGADCQEANRPSMQKVFQSENMEPEVPHWEELLELMNYYLTTVEKMEQSFNTVFPSNPTKMSSKRQLYADVET
ncbi:hypothetical protein K443DRAFT_81708 [Laccaria amethystina LaAM-08-1]|uniref:Uncharacterized protein n=1 Tax=Laccaria amethystina LaAM-08-1 TaxID=1095629 RepID=A0A0C9XY06_9AGAR|nr:hypothetical protein K443DRAFT_81708 [Laccaria amethystina LaAM-08-1]